MTTVIANPTEFQGYPVDLLTGLLDKGPALIGDDALYAVVQAYKVATVDGGSGSALGPALLTADATITVRSSTTHSVPDHVITRPVVAEPKASGPEGWDRYDVSELNALCVKHAVKVEGRVKTPGKLIAALEAAGVTP